MLSRGEEEEDNSCGRVSPEVFDADADKVGAGEGSGSGDVFGLTYS